MFDTLAQLQVVVNCLVLLNLSEVGIGQAFMIAWATPTCPTGRTLAVRLMPFATTTSTKWAVVANSCQWVSLLLRGTWIIWCLLWWIIWCTTLWVCLTTRSPLNPFNMIDFVGKQWRWVLRIADKIVSNHLYFNWKASYEIKKSAFDPHGPSLRDSCFILFHGHSCCA